MISTNQIKVNYHVFFLCFVHQFTSTYSLFSAKIRNLNSVAMWIGINDRGTENRFMWTDGSPVAYLHWGNGKVKGQGLKLCSDSQVVTQIL